MSSTRSSRPSRSRNGRKSLPTEPEFFWSPINSIEDVVADEQFHAAGGVVYVPDGDASVPMVATPADFHGTPWEPRSAAPATRRAHRRGARRTPNAATRRDVELLPAITRSARVLDAAACRSWQEVVIVVAAHQVVRDRDTDSGRDGQRGVGPWREPLEPFAHQRNDARQPLDDLGRLDVDHAQARDRTAGIRR